MQDNREIMREAVALFDNQDRLFAAISELEGSGFDRAEISLLARDGLLDGHPKEEYEDVHEVMDDPETEREPVVSDTDIRQGRTLATGIAGAAAGMGAAGITILTGGAALAALGAAAAAGLGAGAVVQTVGQKAGRSEQEWLREQLEHGGLVLWVRTRSPEHEAKAREILTRHAASEVKIHDIEAPERRA